MAIKPHTTHSPGKISVKYGPVVDLLKDGIFFPLSITYFIPVWL